MAVRRDVEEGKRAGVTGTPAFFVNGRFVSGAQSLEAFSALVDDELSRAAAVGPSGGGRSVGPRQRRRAEGFTIAVPELEFPEAGIEVEATARFGGGVVYLFGW